MDSSKRFSAADQLARMAEQDADDVGVPTSGEGRVAALPVRGGGDAILEAMKPKDQLLMHIPVEEIHPAASGQTRQTFDEEKLQTLAENIRRHGIKEPILVRRDPAGGYEIVAGGRRWRAAKIAGLTHMPAILERKLEGDEGETLLTQVGENVHREDFNPVEEALALATIMEKKGWSVEQAAEEMGKTKKQGYLLLRIHSGPLAVKTRLMQNKIEFRAAIEFIRIFEVFNKQTPKKAIARLDKVIAKAQDWPVHKLAKFARELNIQAEAKRARKAKAGANGDSGEAGDIEIDDVADDAEPLPPAFTQSETRLTIDLARIGQGALAPEERAALITVLDGLLAKLRRT